MRNKFSNPIVFVVALAIGISLSATTALAWDAPTHAHIAGEIMDCGPVCNYNAEMGSLAPDFAWYLRDKGLIDDDEAMALHYDFYYLALPKLNWWNFGLRNFVDGAWTHIFADTIADESIETWFKKFFGDIAEDDKQAFHLAFEFSVGSLLLSQEGLQVWDLLFAHRQAIFVEEVVVEALDSPPEFDVSQEFKKYLALMRILEKIATLYAPYLMKGEVDEGLISEALSWEFLDSVGELSEESLGNYLKVAQILLSYPDQIYRTITGETGGVDWRVAVDKVIEDCVIP